MVKIVDGEIIPDDDPRANVSSPGRVQPQSSSGGSFHSAAAAATPSQRSTFDFSAPPLRFVHEEGAPPGSLPTVLVFGARVRLQHLILLVLAAAFIGWRGLLVGAILLYVYINNQNRSPRPEAPDNQQRRMAAAQSYFDDLLGQGPIGRGGRVGSDSKPRTSQPATSPDPWASKGRAYKLSDS